MVYPKLLLNLKRLENNTLQIVVYLGGSFYENNHGSLQVVFIIYLVDIPQNAPIIYEKAIESRRIVRSDLGENLSDLVMHCMFK